MSKKKFTQPEPEALSDVLPSPDPVAASAPERTLFAEEQQPAPRADERPPLGIDMAAAPHEVDALSAPSIPAGAAPDSPTRPEAPLTLPPTAPPPMGRVAELASEPASLEPPEAVAAEPMAPAPRESSPFDLRPSLPMEGIEPRSHVVTQPEVARQPVPVNQVTQAASEAADPDASVDAPTPARVPAEPAAPGPIFQDAVTLLEISPADIGGVREAALPGNRSESPPSPLAARRIGWNHPVGRWTAYVLVVVALTLVFLWLMISLFRIA